MDAGISTTGLFVAGVPIGNDDCVQQYVRENNVGRPDTMIISDDLIHLQMLRFCQH